MASGTTELIKYINEHVLECSICAEPFKNPKSLPCLHVFCHDCVDTHIQKTISNNHYKCPLCSEDHILPRGGINSLRDGFLQKSLLEVANLIQRKTIVCSSCEQVNDAQSACSTCGDFLCEDCTAVHKRMKLTKNHALVPISELRDTQKLADFQKVRYKICSMHNGEDCMLYCNGDETQICHICTYDPKHKGHDVITIDAKLQQLKTQVKTTKQSLSDTLQKLKEQCKMVSEALTDIEDEERQALDAISSRVQTLEEMIGTYRTKLTEQVNTIATTRKKSLQPLKKKLEIRIEQYEKIVQNTNILDSLPISTAVQVAQDVIKSDNSLTDAEWQSNCELVQDLPQIKFIVSTLEMVKVAPVLKSVIGLVPDVVTKTAPYDILTKMQGTVYSGDGYGRHSEAPAISLIQEVVWETRALTRHSGTYNEMAKTCTEKFEKQSGWTCYIGSAFQFGESNYNRSLKGSMSLVIDDLQVVIHQH